MSNARDEVRPIERLIASIGDPVLETMLQSGEFRHFLVAQEVGLTALIKQTVLHLYRKQYEEYPPSPVQLVPLAQTEANRITMAPSSYVDDEAQAQEEAMIPSTTFPSTSPEKVVERSNQRSEPLTEDSVRRTITEIVCDATGYPPDMIEPDADFEADLRIDSIKMAEIGDLIQEELNLPDVDPDVDDDSFWQETTIDRLTERILSELRNRVRID